MEHGKKRYRYEIVYDSLKDSILNHTYAFGDLLPSENELTRQLNINRTTARKGLELLVSEGLVKKEAGVGSRVIYDNSGRSIAKDSPAVSSFRVNNIGFLLMKDVMRNNQTDQPYYADLFFELEQQCKSKNLRAIYCTIEDNDTDFFDLMSQNDFVGVVFVSSVPEKFIIQASNMHIPLAIINRLSSFGTCIMCNHTQGACLAMDYLYECGHKRIGIIRGASDFVSDDYKMAGCLLSAFGHKHNLNRQLIMRGDWTFSTGYENTLRLFDQPVKPTAIFCFNDIMALGAIKALRELNLAPGKDVSIIGFDNMKQLQYSEPDLATVDCNIAHVAQLAINHVLSIKNGEEDFIGTIQTSVKLIKGKTVCSI